MAEQKSELFAERHGTAEHCCCHTPGRLLVQATRLLEYGTVLWMVLTMTWMPWIKFLSGRTCILFIWILYGNVVDFPLFFLNFYLYVSDLLNVTNEYEYEYEYTIV